MRPPHSIERTAGVLLLAMAAALGGSIAATEPGRSPDEPENPHGELRDECSVCHSPEAWIPAVINPKFDHGDFGFDLAAAHGQTDCMSCHSLVFRVVDPACDTCHQDVHLGELGTDCARCHTATSFIERARMRRAHRVTRFPLRGAHGAADCDECHTPVPQGQTRYVNRDTACESCHLQEYLATTIPDHQAVGFSQRCVECHNETVWQFARITSDPIAHDSAFFPVFSGTHNNEWQLCSECHVSPANYSVFSCILCHQHSDPDRVATQHSGIAGYQYNSQACFSCHPEGI